MGESLGDMKGSLGRRFFGPRTPRVVCVCGSLGSLSGSKMQEMFGLGSLAGSAEGSEAAVEHIGKAVKQSLMEIVSGSPSDQGSLGSLSEPMGFEGKDGAAGLKAIENDSAQYKDLGVTFNELIVTKDPLPIEGFAKFLAEHGGKANKLEMMGINIPVDQHTDLILCGQKADGSAVKLRLWWTKDAGLIPVWAGGPQGWFKNLEKTHDLEKKATFPVRGGTMNLAQMIDIIRPHAQKTYHLLSFNCHDFTADVLADLRQP